MNRTVAEGVADLERSVEQLRRTTDPMGIELIGSGTHPFARWQDQQVTDKERYVTLMDRTGVFGRQLLIWGVHMHVGLDEPAKALPVLDALLAYYPHLQALSASSPFVFGESSGYASSRAMLFQQLPTAGLPPQLESWEQYESIVEDLIHVGVIDHWDEIRWDIRPSAKWGTVETRVCDGLPTTFEIGALTALVQCLVDDFSERLDAGETLPTLQPWFVRENKWRAARYGMDAEIIVDRDGAEAQVEDEIRALVDAARAGRRAARLPAGAARRARRSSRSAPPTSGRRSPPRGPAATCARSSSSLVREMREGRPQP